VAPNFLQHLSGIATLTARFVEAPMTGVKVRDTRKTSPAALVIARHPVAAD
jgi:nicotinate-nucleotide pyrophosphorylase (carboxylating)